MLISSIRHLKLKDIVKINTNEIKKIVNLKHQFRVKIFNILKAVNK